MHSDWQMCAGDPILRSTGAANFVPKVEIMPGCHAFSAFQKVAPGEICQKQR